MGACRILFAGVSLAALLGGCSDSFGDCHTTRTCAQQPDAATHVDAGFVGAGGSAGASGTTATGGMTASGGATGGAGGASAGGATGMGATGGADASVEAGTTPSGRDGGGLDAAADSGPHCPDGFADCNGRPDDGCEVELAKDKDHCGKCGTSCAASGTTANTCDDGTCKAVCDATHADCNADGSDGCEADLQGDPDHCGLCATKCDAAGTAQRACTAGVCKPVCDATHADCNKDGKDGCEVDLQGDAAHCGACTTTCATTGTAQHACMAGVCKPVCDATHADCNKDGKDGCEVDLQSNADHCGACDTPCSATNAKARACVAGTCTPACNAGFADCSATQPKPDDGCETNVNLPTSCGVCGHSCLGGACSAMHCAPLSLGSSLPTPKGIAVDDKYVHWCDGTTQSGRLMRVPLNGGAATPVDGSLIDPYDAVSDGTNVYFTTRGVTGGVSSGIQRVQSGGTSVVPMVNGFYDPDVVSPSRIAIDATNIYFTNGTNGAVYKLPKVGGDTTLIPEIQTAATSIAVDSGHVYTTFLDVYRAPISGTETPLELTNGTALTVAADDTYVYFPKSDSQNVPHLYRVASKNFTGTPTDLGTVSMTPTSPLALDATYIYYADESNLYRIAKAGMGTPQPLSNLVSAVFAIVVTKDAVYWSNTGTSDANGSVMKLAL